MRNYYFFITKKIKGNPVQFGKASFLSHGYKYSVRRDTKYV